MKRGALTSAVLVLAMLAISAHAGYKWEGFVGGNAPGFIKLGNYTWNEQLPVDYKMWRAGGQSWGITMSSKITVRGARSEGSGYWMNSGGYKKATWEARCCAIGSGGAVYSWAAWWTYNDRQTYNNYFEVDMMECCPTGNYFNYYYHWSNGVVGKHMIYGGSYGWRSGWNKYKDYTADAGKVYYYFNGSYKTGHSGVDRGGEYARPKFNNRPWGAKVRSDNAAVQNIPTLGCDWYQVWY